jgi:hypothetical protein
MRAAGAVAVVAGAHQLLTGVAGVRGGPGDAAAMPALRNVDSELRFYGAWYAVSGSLMLRNSAQEEPDAATTRLVGAGWLAAAAGRVLSMRAVGRPGRLFMVLTAAECAVAAVLLAGNDDFGGLAP